MSVALDKWMELNKAVQIFGYYEPHVFQDEVLNKVVESFGGWRSVCAMKYDKLQKNFIQRYKEISQS